MTKIILTVITVFVFCGFGYSQEINQFDENGERTGVWKKYYPNEHLRYEGAFKNGQEIGVFKFYSMNSSEKPIVVKTFNEKYKEAKVQFYTKKGVIESEGMMLAKNRIGKWLYYHTDGKLIMIEENYKNGKLDGDYKLFYKNAQLTKFAHYKNGKLNGNSKQYTTAGVLIEDLNYVNGELHGDAVYYETIGSVKQKGAYENDLKIGEWEIYQNGKLSKTTVIKAPIKKDN